MQKSVFVVFDKTENRAVGYFEAPTFGHIIRNNWQYFKKINPYFYEDWQGIEIGSVGADGLICPYLGSELFKYHSWEEYESPEYVSAKMSDEERRKLELQPVGITGNPPPNP